jgi:isopenicillin N synthase-like dioxygenase
MDTFPVVDFADFLAGKPADEACKLVAKMFHDTGILIVRDPRVSESDNEEFLRLMEAYYDQPDEVKLKDVHPELCYQVGATPEGTEVARAHPEVVQQLAEKPIAWDRPDPKWRFFWRIGPRPAQSKYPELNATQVMPAAFPQWEESMNKWGSKMMAAVVTACQMLAQGLELPCDTFTSMMENGPHLLAPTGSNIGKYHEVGTVLANFHYDLSFIACHGKARYPGLFVWLRDGTKVQVRVPTGCLVMQAGKQAEWVTGGYVMAGFHEVVVTKDTVAAWEKAKAEGRSQWRASSTLFSHIASDKIMQPVAKFATPEALAKWPPIEAGAQVAEELQQINLKA